MNTIYILYSHKVIVHSVRVAYISTTAVRAGHLRILANVAAVDFTRIAAILGFRGG